MRIQDLAAEMSPEALSALAAGEGLEIRVRRLDLLLPPESVATLARRLAGLGEGPPSLEVLEVEEGRLAAEGSLGGKRFRVDLLASALRVELTAGGLRIRTE